MTLQPLDPSIYPAHHNSRQQDSRLKTSATVENSQPIPPVDVEVIPSVEEVNEWVEDDFTCDGNPVPTTDELISHIEYQLVLSDCCDAAEEGGSFAETWFNAMQGDHVFLD